MREGMLVVDFGGQYAKLIGQRIRDLGTYSFIVDSQDVTNAHLAHARGIVLSGGPANVAAATAPGYNPAIFTANVPKLAICYGHQLAAHAHGGRVVQGEAAEYADTAIHLVGANPLFDGIERKISAWMSHQDFVAEVPAGFSVTARSENGVIAGMRAPNLNLFTVQFHPEVTHTPTGMQMLRNFLLYSNAPQNWSFEQGEREMYQNIGDVVQGRCVYIPVSGGVDSSVAARAVFEAKRLGYPVGPLTLGHVNTGLMRLNESKNVVNYFRQMPGMESVVLEEAGPLFLERLAGVIDPEQKRQIIGNTFVDVFDRMIAAQGFPPDTVICQGTLYTDLIESAKRGRNSQRIKTHHNTSEYVERKRAQGLILEPLSEFFKDGARELGRRYGMPSEIVDRWPFPGPGIGIRISGVTITEPLVSIVQVSDDIFTQEIRNAGLEKDIWQAFAGLKASRSVGVVGDARSYGYDCWLRAVTSVDGMTADAYDMPMPVLKRTMKRITNAIKDVGRVAYDLTSKPPATIEWE